MSNQKEIVFSFLIDFSKESYQALNFIIKAAKKVNGSIDLFYTHDSIDLSIEANPLSILRDLDVECRIAESKLKSVIELIEVENIPVTGNSFFGDLLSELEAKNKALTKNHIVVFGKTTNGLSQEKIKYLFKKYNGSVLILSEGHKLGNGSVVVVEDLLNDLKISDLRFPIEYCSRMKTPIIVLQSNYTKDKELNELLMFPKNKELEVFYQTLRQSKLVADVKDFINSNNVKMLCIGRENSNPSLFTRLFQRNRTITDITNEINVPILIMSKSK